MNLACAELIEAELARAGLTGCFSIAAASPWATPAYTRTAARELGSMRRQGWTHGEILGFLASHPTSIGRPGAGDGSSNIEYEADF